MEPELDASEYLYQNEPERENVRRIEPERKTTRGRERDRKRKRRAGRVVTLESKAGGEYIRKKSAYCSIQQLMLAASFRSYVKTGNFV